VRTVDGTTWTRVPSPNPGLTVNALFGVSCTSAPTCTAVGKYSGRTVHMPPELPLIVRTDDGATWHQVPAAPGGIARAGYLNGVDCVTADRCRAVGGVSPDGHAIVLRTTNGEDWYRQVTPKRGVSSWATSIDCVSDTECTAVGSHAPPAAAGGVNGVWRTLVLRTTDGRTWAQVPSPNPNPQFSQAALYDVSCIGSVCTAVGDLHPRPGPVERGLIVRTTDGITWMRMPTPVMALPGLLTSVSCTSATDCTAVGSSSDGSPFRITTLLRTTNGTSWASPSPVSEKPGRQPWGVSCATPSGCVAVGDQVPTLTERRALVLRET
jgi:photosystem II stability/assembly factor-like uncharacterized protein